MVHDASRVFGVTEEGGEAGLAGGDGGVDAEDPVSLGGEGKCVGGSFSGGGVGGGSEGVGIGREGRQEEGSFLGCLGGFFGLIPGLEERAC